MRSQLGTIGTGLIGHGGARWRAKRAGQKKDPRFRESMDALVGRPRFELGTNRLKVAGLKLVALIWAFQRPLGRNNLVNSECVVCVV